MSEFEVMEIIQGSLEQLVSHLQWWASVSFGLIALTHFAGAKLTRTYVIGLLILYSLFTAYSVLNSAMAALGAGYYQGELIALRDSGELSAAGVSLLEQWLRVGPVGTTVVISCQAGTFLGAVLFLIHTYRRKGESPSS